MSILTRLYCYIFAAVFAFIRIAAMVTILFWSCVWCCMCGLIYPKGSKELRAACHRGTVWTGTLLAATGSVLSIKFKNKEADYKKYLGPDWKPYYDKFSTVIANH